MVHELFNILNWLGSGWVLILLGCLSVLTLYVILSRFQELKNLTGVSNRFWQEQAEAWFLAPSDRSWLNRTGEFKEHYPCLETDTLYLIATTDQEADSERIVGAYLENRRLKLEKHVGILGTIGSNAPYIGLLGTVLGIMRAFHDIAAGGLGTGMENITAGIAEALVATAVGLFVAVPAVIFFNLLNKQITVLLRKANSVSQLALGHNQKNKRS